MDKYELLQNRINKVCDNTGWDAETAMQKLQEAKKLGIPNGNLFSMKHGSSTKMSFWN